METKLIEANIKLVDRNKLLERDVRILEDIIKDAIFFVTYEEYDKEKLLKILKGEKDEK